MVNAERIPHELRATARWSVWRHQSSTNGIAAFDAREHQPVRAWATVPTTWSHFAVAWTRYLNGPGRWDGVAFAQDGMWVDAAELVRDP